MHCRADLFLPLNIEGAIISFGHSGKKDRDAGGKGFAYAVQPVQEGKEVTMPRGSIALSSVRGKAALVFGIGRTFKQGGVFLRDRTGDAGPKVFVSYSGVRNVTPCEKAWG